MDEKSSTEKARSSLFVLVAVMSVLSAGTGFAVSYFAAANTPAIVSKEAHEEKPEPKKEQKHEDKHAAPAEPAEASADTPLAALEAGNARFLASARKRSTATTSDAARRTELSKGQHPIVTLLTCADSRIVPEFIFDQTMGTIFVVRNAGNVVDPDVLASSEYAVEHLHTPLVLVMGHTSCGAVKAVSSAQGKPLPGNLVAIQDNMPHLRETVSRPHEETPEFLRRLTEENVKGQAHRLLAGSAVIRTAIDKGHAVLAAAVYELDTGAVKVLEREVKESK